MGMMNQQIIDLHQLELRYAGLRVRNGSRVRRLAESISRHGQLEAMLAVADEETRLILVNGYQRYAALRYLGRDTGLIMVASGPESQAIFHLLVQRGERRWEAIEEAGLIQELHRRLGFSLSEIGGRMGRDKSYVKRRLDLLESLPEEILRHILAGSITTWAAIRVLVPLARANADDAAKLAAHLAREPMTTRELQLFYEHYRQANRRVRERMLDSPALFLQSVQAVAAGKDDSPEEKWLHDATMAGAILTRLQEKTAMVFYPGQEKKLRRQLLVRAARVRRLSLELQQLIKERLSHDRPRQGTADPGDAQPGHEKAGDRPATESLPPHRGPGAQGADDQTAGQQGVGIRPVYRAGKGTVPGVPSQCRQGAGGACGSV
jgi:ParB-like chromosome segregation protein Spo0J